MFSFLTEERNFQLLFLMPLQDNFNTECQVPHGHSPYTDARKALSCFQHPTMSLPELQKSVPTIRGLSEECSLQPMEPGHLGTDIVGIARATFHFCTFIKITYFWKHPKYRSNCGQSAQTPYWSLDFYQTLLVSLHYFVSCPTSHSHNSKPG